MRTWKFCWVVAVAIAIGCGSDRAEHVVDPVVGIKIYETERALPELFDEWRELGVNTVFVARDLFSRDEFHALAVRNRVETFVIFPVFYAPDELEDDPNLWAVTADGQRAKEDWVEFACPSRREFRERRVAEAVEIARMCQPDGLSIDFIRHFTFWEMVDPNRQPASLPDTCFCPVCLEGFAEFAGLDPASIPETPRQAADWVRSTAPDAWLRFKTATITSMVAEIVAAVREVDPRIKINVHIVPWRSADYDNAIERVVAQDRSALSELADYLSPMCYSFMLHREPDWVASVVADVASAAACPVLPSIQVASAYREDADFAAEDFEASLRSALEPPSAGVIFWSWGHIEASPEKREIIRRLLGSD